MEGRHCFEHLTVEENLLTGAYTRKEPKKIDEAVSTASDPLADLKEILISRPNFQLLFLFLQKISADI